MPWGVTLRPAIRVPRRVQKHKRTQGGRDTRIWRRDFAPAYTSTPSRADAGSQNVLHEDATKTSWLQIVRQSHGARIYGREMFRCFRHQVLLRRLPMFIHTYVT